MEVLQHKTVRGVVKHCLAHQQKLNVQQCALMLCNRSPSTAVNLKRLHNPANMLRVATPSAPELVGVSGAPHFSSNGLTAHANGHGQAKLTGATNGKEVTDADGAMPAAAASASTPKAGPVVQPFTLQERKPLAGGMLDLIYLEEGRMLRVWTPPGYRRADAPRDGYPLLLLNDGQNLFDDSMSFSGSSWKAADTAADLITSGQLPEFVVVGIDHAGPNRSLDYLPYKPGTGPKAFRPDAAAWPGGGVDAYLQRVVDQILPYVTKQYGCSTDRRLRAFGGSSFGGICALCAAMKHSGVFGAVLVESPSLWFAEEKFLLEDIAQHDWASCPRMFVGMGGREYSGIRKKELEKPEFDAMVADYVPALMQTLVERGANPAQLLSEVEEKATHTESSWAQRLPRALKFLLADWWTPLAERHSGSLYFTSPRKLKAGKPAVLFVNKPRSTPLAAASKLHLLGGFNDWQVGKLDAAMQPANHIPGTNGSEWWSAQVTVPEQACEFNFALSDGDQVWDNNDGANFYAPVKAMSTQLGQAAGQPAANALEAAIAAAGAPADEVAKTSGHKLFFTMPEVPVAGAPVTVYVNKMRSWALSDSPNVRVHYGFNSWEMLGGDTHCSTTNLWRGEGVFWWSTRINIPEGATELNMVFNNGGGSWDSNNGNNYNVPVRDVNKEATSVARTIEKEESMQHGAGTLHLLTLTKRAGSTKASKWYEEKMVRVWTPPGFNRDDPPPGGYPVLYFNDGQNLFEDWLAHQGVSWKLGYTASELVTSGQVPPFVIAAIDSVGSMRSFNFLPHPPGTGVGGFRGDCERWPGGGLDAYMHRITSEIMPMVTQRFATSTDPEKVAFGGGSFAGVTTLYAAMHYPHVFGSILSESPSLWVTEARFLEYMAAHRGPLPERIFIGCGTKEYSATRDHVREDVDALLLHYYCEAARILGEKGMRGPRLRFLVEEGAGHHELAWQWRLTGALQFIAGAWWDA